ncbi:hypothetical protein ILP97_25070 [Amycolatopsis sp. H6(2020)]|nr:hypothetical protein [Amycolatopsis sp. H6(2020)]
MPSRATNQQAYLIFNTLDGNPLVQFVDSLSEAINALDQQGHAVAEGFRRGLLS